MLISDVLRTKGHNVVKIHPADSVELAARKLAEHRIGALVVEDRWMKPVGIFSERDFINAVARDGAAALGFQVHQLMSTPMGTCRSSDRVDAVLATMTIARIRHLPIIEDNALKGIVSIGDLVKHRLAGAVTRIEIVDTGVWRYGNRFCGLKAVGGQSADAVP
jgi:CBS domain-containing protein